MEAIIYAAKSTEDVHGSIPTQLEDARALVEREGGEVVAEYSEEAASAWSGDRGPQLAKAMEHAERIAPCWLVVQHTDRLARGDGKQSRHLVEIVLWGLKSDVTIRSVQDDSTGENLVMAAVMGMRNNEDSTRKSKAVAAGMKRGAEAGNPPGGPRPYGYEYGDRKNVLEVVPGESAIVQRIFADFTAGKSLTAIARSLHERGVETMKGGPWRSSTVSGILRNPVYVGRVKHKGETFPGNHEAVIDETTWEKAVQLLKSRPASGRGRHPKGNHLFRGGFLRCSCGEAMVPRTTREGWEYYYCNGRSKFGKDFCRMPSKRRRVIDEAVFDYFARVGLDVEATRQQLADERDRNLAEVHALRVQAEREAQLAAERLARVRGHFQDGNLAAWDWEEQRDQLTAERDASEAEVERLLASEQSVERDEGLADVERETLERLSAIRRAIAGEVRDGDGTDAVRAALTRLFSRFIVHRIIERGEERRPVAKPNNSEPDEEIFTGCEPVVFTDEPAAAATCTIEPVIRASAVESFNPERSIWPVLKRQPLEHAGNKEGDGSPTDSLLFGPIPVVAMSH